MDSLRVGLLVVTLALACITDARRHKIPNQLTLPALLLGLLLAAGQHRLGTALAGVGVASLALLAYAGRALGAGDVKLLWVVGALTGPLFTLWTLLGTALAGGLLALAWAARHGALRQALRDAAWGGQMLLTTRTMPVPSQGAARRMPYAPAIALGVLMAAALRHGGLAP